jgi:hypothetical protein
MVMVAEGVESAEEQVEMIVLAARPRPARRPTKLNAGE